MTIPVIPTFTGDIPDRNAQDAATFTINSIDWLDYQVIQIPATNVSIEGINATALQVTADAATSAANANFKGRWIDLTGVLNIPASVERSDRIYQLLENLADVTLEDPLTSSKWLVISEHPKGNITVDGRFDFWFEAVSQTSSGFGSSTMWRNDQSVSTKTTTRETLVLGVDIPDVPTAKFFSRTDVSSGNTATSQVRMRQSIEDVRKLAGKKATLSLYARVDSVKNIAIELVQSFGAGGSTTITGIGSAKALVSTNFERIQFQVDIPSMAVKTIGADSSLQLFIWFDAGSSLDARTDSLGNQDGIFDIACVQLEEGSVATNFKEDCEQDALSRVNRHYWQGDNNADVQFLFSNSAEINMVSWDISFPTTMRVSPVITTVSATTFENCIFRSFNSNTHAFSLSVDTSGSGTYRAHSGVYSADARL